MVALIGLPAWILLIVVQFVAFLNLLPVATASPMVTAVWPGLLLPRPAPLLVGKLLSVLLELHRGARKSRSLFARKHLTHMIALCVHLLLGRQRVDEERQHRLGVQLVAIVLPNLFELVFSRYSCFIREWLDTLLGLLHDVFVLKALDIGLLALHVRVEKSARLPSHRVSTYLVAVAR